MVATFSVLLTVYSQFVIFLFAPRPAACFVTVATMLKLHITEKGGEFRLCPLNLGLLLTGLRL